MRLLPPAAQRSLLDFAILEALEGEPLPISPVAIVEATEDRDEVFVLAVPHLRRTLARFRIPVADVADVMQDVFLLFLQKQAQIKDPVRWMQATARNRCLRYWRDSRSRLIGALDAGLLDLMASPGSADSERIDLRHDLNRALAHLRPRCRELLHLRYVEGRAPFEIARKLRYSLDSVRKLTARCLATVVVHWFSRDGLLHQD